MSPASGRRMDASDALARFAVQSQQRLQRPSAGRDGWPKNVLARAPAVKPRTGNANCVAYACPVLAELDFREESMGCVWSITWLCRDLASIKHVFAVGDEHSFKWPRPHECGMGNHS
ncbi:hypothetical protein HIM_03606 [Hirsutella minnesotensis 3608]|uniref:Uncharacterized protein n=1 Tax=Hirsutella minnesotensis 3608 TaxID=1043627 RepID=A0A0F7ZQI0_9HYPO|nr:hypothetical protein HIM_03606 [Hirsutella minnesotensis 3608]